MTEIQADIFLIAGLVFTAIAVLQIALTVVTFVTLKNASRERNQLNKEMFGLVKKIEGLTATRREQMVKHYDSMLETLSKRLPLSVAAEASNTLIEIERKILSRLAELEPSLSQDDESKKKMDDLVRSMERLEETLVAVASNTVKQVMSEGRRELLANDDSLDESLVPCPESFFTSRALAAGH